MQDSDPPPKQSPKKVASSKPVPPGEAKAAVTGQLHDFADQFEEHGMHLVDARVGDPVITETLRSEDRSYYLVPIFLNAALPHFVARVDGPTGALICIEGISSEKPGKETWVFTLLGQDELEERLRKAHKKYVPHSWQSTGRLVWVFCRQSTSPYHPFHEMKQRGVIGFMDVRGKIHTELDLPGGKWSANIPDPPKNE